MELDTPIPELGVNLHPSLRPTANALEGIGSLVFEAAVTAMPIEEQLARSLLRGTLQLHGLLETELQYEHLVELLPEIEERMSRALPSHAVQTLSTALREFVANWGVIATRG